MRKLIWLLLLPGCTWVVEPNNYYSQVWADQYNVYYADAGDCIFSGAKECHPLYLKPGDLK